MDLDADACYRALTARDPRFDGVFFVAVTSTRIYCRPICPARTPGLQNCRFFPGAAAAEAAGFRPCLRCRPELAPGHAPVDAVGRTARLAATRIGELAAQEDVDLEGLAGELGVGPRHLRRAVRRSLGVSPVELVQTHRLLLAKQLLTETALPITQVAFASGFASVRRFNSLFRDRYRLTPSDLRKSGRAVPAGDSIRLRLSYRPPLAWDDLLRFLAARAIAGVEAVDGRTYLRTVALGESRGWLRVAPVAGRPELAVELPIGLTGVLPRVLAGVRRLFDLDARPDVIAAHLGRDPLLGERVRANPGLRVPGAFDGFGLAVRVILGQRVSVRAASTVMGRLVDALGEPIATPFPALTRLGPTPGRVADASLGELTGFGIAPARAESIRALAWAVADGRLSLGAGQDPEAWMARIADLPGVGPWTAHFIALRVLRWPDAFPHADLGLTQALGDRPARAVLELAEAWRPWRAYAAMHLWKGPAGAGPPAEPDAR